MMSTTKGNILVVDDTPNNLRLLIEVLSQEGYQVRPAPTGERALSAARLQPPDLILLDIMMPGMDGYEVCRTLKEEAATRDIPVIFLSALDEVFNKMEAFDAGGVDYVTKPFEAREVLARVATHLKISRLQQELEAQNAELNAFAHTVAHDLKSPLSIVQGYTSMMLEDLSNILTEDGVKYVQRIQDGALKASKIIDELLLLAGIGRQQVEITAVNMHEPVALALDRLQMRIQEYQPEIIKPETWPKAKGYSPWIEEVWANYISNALKYGGQSPRVELGSTPLGNGLIQFWVQDNGPGLTSEEQAKLFAEFSRINTDRAQGHGLGLSIVRRIVKRLGGEVGVESQPGQGSKFYFTLPAA
jgi:signal transduction histidine kinase